MSHRIIILFVNKELCEPERAQWVRAIAAQHEDLTSDIQHPWEKPGVDAVYL